MAGRAVPPDDGAHLANVLGAVTLDVTTRVAGAVAAATGLSMVHATAVSVLANFGEGESIDRLRRSVGLSHSAAVRVVDRLVERGLVVRGPAADGRVVALRLTAAGRDTARAVRDARRAVLDAVVAAVPPAHRASLVAVLDALAARDVDVTPDGTELVYRLCRLCDPEGCGHPEGCPVTTAYRR